MIVSGYTLDLYCDRDDVKHPYKAFPHDFFGENRTQASRQARKTGWLVRHATKTREGRAVCPACRKKRLK